MREEDIKMDILVNRDCSGCTQKCSRLGDHSPVPGHIRAMVGGGAMPVRCDVEVGKGTFFWCPIEHLTPIDEPMLQKWGFKIGTRFRINRSPLKEENGLTGVFCSAEEVRKNHGNETEAMPSEHKVPACLDGEYRGNRYWFVVVHYLTEIDEAKVELKAGDTVRVLKPAPSDFAFWLDGMDYWVGKVIKLTNRYTCQGILFYQSTDAVGMIDGRSVPWSFRDSWLEKTEPVETFPGGFKVGDRVEWEHSPATVISWDAYEKSNGNQAGRHGVPFRFDNGEEAWSDLSSGKLKHLKESEPAPAPEAPPEHIPDQACGETEYRECIRHDDYTMREAGCNQLMKLCLMCGALIPADNWKHETSIECGRRRDRRHLPELPRMRPMEEEE